MDRKFSAPSTNARRIRGSLLRTVGAWTLAGLGTGSFVAYLTVAANDSIRSFADACVLHAWVGLIYAIALAGVGLAATLVGWVCRIRPSRESAAFGAHIVAAYATGAAFWAAYGLVRHPIIWPAVQWQKYCALALAAAAAGGVAVISPALLIGVARRRAFRRTTAAVAALAVVAPLAFAYRVLLERSVNVHEPLSIKTNKTGRRVILLGLDGLDWRILRPLMEAGRLPNLKRLRDSGVSADLTTTVPTYSPIIWTTILSGVGESKHGIHDFTEMYIPGLRGGVQRFFNKPELLPKHVGMSELIYLLRKTPAFDYSKITSAHRRVKTVWNVVSEAGMRAAVLNWYATFPTEPLNGVLVSDRFTFAFGEGMAASVENVPGIVYPASYIKTIEASIAEYALPDVSGFFAVPDGADGTIAPTQEDLTLFGRENRADHMIAATGLHIARERSADFLAILIAGIDRCSHLYVPRMPYIVDRYYEYVDVWVGRYLETADDRTTIIVVSDHGWSYGDDGEPLGHWHAPDGVFIAAGDGIAAAGTLSRKPSVLDIAPTILALLGIPPSEELDGRVITEALAPEVTIVLAGRSVATYGRYHPPKSPTRRSAPSKDEIRRTIDRLKALGYVGE